MISPALAGRNPQTREDGRVRVLHFITNFAIGGTERQFMTLGAQLDPSRFELHVACLRRMGPFLEEIERRECPLSEYSIRKLYGLGTIRQQLRLAAYLRHHRIQIVHTYGLYPNIFAIPAARLAGVRAVVASIRDTGDIWPPMQIRTQNLVCRLAHRIAVNAQAIKLHLVNQGYEPGKIVVIPNGIDLGRFERPGGHSGLRRQLGIPENAPVVVVLSRLNRDKGVDHLLRAVAIIRRSDTSPRFLIVGDGGYREALERTAVELGVADSVIFAGFRLDIPEILSESTISVLPSLSEGLSNALLESMAAGLPVVATRVGGNPEVVDEGVTGLLVPAADAEALASAILGLLDRPETAAAFGRAGRRRVAERFSRERMVRDTERLYLEMLTSARVESLAPQRHPNPPAA